MFVVKRKTLKYFYCFESLTRSAVQSVKKFFFSMNFQGARIEEINSLPEYQANLAKMKVLSMDKLSKLTISRNRKSIIQSDHSE